MKVGIFTDAHYSSQEQTCGKRRNNRSLDKIRAAYDAFAREGCELVVCLGDLIDTEQTVAKEIENLRRIGEIMRASAIRTVCLMGNHDAFLLTPEQFYAVLGIEPPQHIRRDGCELIFLDACYFSDGRHYAPGDSDWTDTYLPDAEGLRAKLGTGTGRVYLFLHQNVDLAVREDHRLSNARELCDMIEQSGRVAAVFQGHYHNGALTERGGVRYVTLAAMCESERGFEVFDL